MVSNKGFNEGVITLGYKGGAVGDPVTVTENGACAPCEAGQKPVGILLGQRSGIASVQVMGHQRVKYSGTAPSLGMDTIVADGNGGIKAAANGREVIVLAVESVAGTVVIIL